MMGDRLYVASRKRHAKMWREFRKAGYPIISKWIDLVDEAGLDTQSLDVEKFWADILALEMPHPNCTGLILYTEKSDFPLKGALVEVGMALAFGHRVRVVTSDYEIEPVTYKPLGSWIMSPTVSLWNSVEDALESFNYVEAAPNPKMIPKEVFMRW